MKDDYRVGFKLYFLILLQTKLASAQTSSAFNSTCFKATPVFGSTTNANLSTDLTYLTSPLFRQNYVVTQINICGTFSAFEGIQIFLAGGGFSLAMNSIGRAVSCDKNVLAPNTYIS